MVAPATVVAIALPPATVVSSMNGSSSNGSGNTESMVRARTASPPEPMTMATGMA